MVPNEKSVIYRLPDIIEDTSLKVEDLVTSFNLPRSVIASYDEICEVWERLPKLIKSIPAELRDEFIVRMCISVSVGLFDSAVNYIWNAVIIELRKKVKQLGLSIIGEILGHKDFDEEELNGLRDAELIDLCYKIELLSKDGYFMLNQCRELRNNFSTAHPSIGQIDDNELINFINRCCKYGLKEENLLKGVKLNDFVNAVKGEKLDSDLIEYWAKNLTNTFPAQRQLLMPMLLTLYCDETVSESARLNALNISEKIVDSFDEKIKSKLIDQHNEYLAKDPQKKGKASRNYFEKIGMISLLSESEKHTIFSKACKNLCNAHDDYNNFYNEPPFAERLAELSKATRPDSVKHDYVYIIMLCYIGNPYGVSRAAVGYYKEMIENFSKKEIALIFGFYESNNTLANRIKNHRSCKERFVLALELLDKENISRRYISAYNSFLSKK